MDAIIEFAKDNTLEVFELFENFKAYCAEHNWPEDYDSFAYYLEKL